MRVPCRLCAIHDVILERLESCQTLRSWPRWSQQFAKTLVTSPKRGCSSFCWESAALPPVPLGCCAARASACPRYARSMEVYYPAPKAIKPFSSLIQSQVSKGPRLDPTSIVPTLGKAVSSASSSGVTPPSQSSSASSQSGHTLRDRIVPSHSQTLHISVSIV